MEAAIIPGAIYRGAIIRGQFVGGQFSGGQFFGHVNLMITPSSGCFIAEIKQSHKPTSLTGSNTYLKGEKDTYNQLLQKDKSGRVYDRNL